MDIDLKFTESPEVLVEAFWTYVRPILEYCTPVWSPHPFGLVDKIEKPTSLYKENFLFVKFIVQRSSIVVETRFVYTLDVSNRT